MFKHKEREDTLRFKFSLPILLNRLTLALMFLLMHLFNTACILIEIFAVNSGTPFICVSFSMIARILSCDNDLCVASCETVFSDMCGQCSTIPD